MLAKYLASCLVLSVAALASPTPQLTSLGYIQVSVGKSVIGYVSKSQNSYGEYIGVSPDNDSSDIKHRLLVEYNSTATGPQSLIAQNGPDNTFPFFGAIEGEQGANLGSTGNYLLIGGTGETSAGAPMSYVGNSFTDATGTSRMASSAIWQVNQNTGKLTAVTINNNGASPNATYIGYVDEDGFVLSGSKSKFQSTWSDSVEWVTFTITSQ